MRRRQDSLTMLFKPRTDILPKPQQEIWPQLAPGVDLSFVLYGGTAVALHLGHRTSIDFDFFSSVALDKNDIIRRFSFMATARVVQEETNTFVVIANMSHGSVKVSFFGGLRIGRINAPLRTQDGVLLVASTEDLLATKLKAILDRAEAKDYLDIAALLRADTSLPRSLAGFNLMYGRDPGLPLRAMGFFKDGDLPSLPESDRDVLRRARDSVSELPEVSIKSGSLA